MNKVAKKKAESFLKEYGLTEITVAELRKIIQSQGYTIVEYNHILNDEHVAALIEALDLEEMITKTNGFTYADRQRRLVFLHEDLSAREKLLVLAHEEGHIYCDHVSAVPIIGRDVVEEHEANEFTHYILNRGIRGKTKSFLRNHKKLVGIAAGVLAAVLLGTMAFGVIRKARSYYGKYYITATGDRYHEKECIFVKYKTSVHRMTIEEFESGDYEPCGICLPHADTDIERGDVHG